MKIIKALLSVCMIAVGILAMTSCDAFHEHKLNYSVAKLPTCTETGIIKIICTECGDMNYADVNKLGHNYINGFCTVCGADEANEGKITHIEMPTDTSHNDSWTFREIYDTAKSMGYGYSYSNFVSAISKSEIALKDASISTLNLFTVTASMKDNDGVMVDTPLAIPLARVDIKNTADSLGSILRMDITNGVMLITYRDGTERVAGEINGSYNSSIEGFAINNEGELFFYYTDNTIAFIGSLLE